MSGHPKTESRWSLCLAQFTKPEARLRHHFLGEWKDGRKYGQGTGTLYYNDGDVNNPANRSVYVGEFKDGKEHGQGTWTSKYMSPTVQNRRVSPHKYIGEYKDGERWNGTLYDLEGKIMGKWTNGIHQTVPRYKVEEQNKCEWKKVNRKTTIHCKKVNVKIEY